MNLELEVQGCGGVEVVLLYAGGNELVVLVGEVEAEGGVLADLGVEGGDGVHYPVAAPVVDGGLVEGGVLEGEVVGDLLAHLEAEGDTAYLVGHALNGFEVLGVLEHVGCGDGVVAGVGVVDAVFATHEEVETIVVHLDGVAVDDSGYEGAPAVVLPYIELDATVEVVLEHLTFFETVGIACAGVESEDAVVAFNTCVGVEDGGVYVTRFPVAAETEFVAPFFLCRNSHYCCEHDHDYKYFAHVFLLFNMLVILIYLWVLPQCARGTKKGNRSSYLFGCPTRTRT